jgi:hypothetical protein
MSPRGLRQGIRRSLHAGALVFTSWWLIATSAPSQPARDCYTGIGDTTRLRVTLGAATAAADGAGTSNVSCGSLDGLAEGTALIFDLTHGPRPEVFGQACYAYQTTGVSGTTDVIVEPTPAGVGVSQDLTNASGTFTSSTRVSCRGSWAVWLGPESAPGPGELLSPLDAGGARRWTLKRSMQIPQGQFCDGVFSEAGPVACSDTFLVESIAEEPAP